MYISYNNVDDAVAVHGMKKSKVCDALEDWLMFIQHIVLLTQVCVSLFLQSLLI